MSRTTRLSAVVLATLAGCAIAFAGPDDKHDHKHAHKQGAKEAAKTGNHGPENKELSLPAGMSVEDMQACMEAGIPGEMHARLLKDVGVWQGKTKMWMSADSEPMLSECTTTFSPMMDGRYIKMEIVGEIPGMGTFNGMGVYGFDNVSQKFQCTWIDNHSTGMMTGTGELAPDGKTINWRYTYNCPVTKKATTMREVQRHTGDNTMVVEMYAKEPRTEKEYKMMEVVYTRATGHAATNKTH